MSKCLLTSLAGKSLKISMTFSRAFSCSKCLLANYYETLKVSPSATTKEIKQAYFKLSKENHPDLHPNDPSCHDRFIRLQEAYKVLSNPSSRKQYDTTAVNKRGASYYQRSYDKPDFSARDEWIRKQNERVREMKYGEHFGRKYDDPRNFYEQYSRPGNLSPEEMELFLKRKRFARTFNGYNIFLISFVIFMIITMSDSFYTGKVRHDYYQQNTRRNAEMLARMRDPYYMDSRAWEERDRLAREKMAEVEKKQQYGDQ